MILQAAWLGIATALAGGDSWESPEPGQVHLGVHSGFPWQGIHVEYAPSKAIALTGHVETALFKRTEVRIGAQRSWAFSQKWSAVTHASLGAVHQLGGNPRQGPQLGAMLELSRTGKVEPYFSLHDRELFARKAEQTIRSSGEETTWTTTRYFSRGGTLGLRIPIRNQWCADLAVRAGSMDNEFSIPSLLVGIDWRSE